MNNLSNKDKKKMLGPVWDYYNNPEIFDLVIDHYNECYFFRTSEDYEKVSLFDNQSELDEWVKNLLSYFPEVDHKMPSHMIPLDEYTRLHILKTPYAFKGPCITMTRIPDKLLGLEDLIKFDALDEQGLEIIDELINSNQGLLIAGNVGSGKTTLLNIVLNKLPMPNRVLTLERVPDLIVERPHTCRLTTPNQTDGEMLDLIRIAEQMRGDIHVLSECHGREVYPFIQMAQDNSRAVALCAGTSAKDALTRLVTKIVVSSDGLNLEEARNLLASVFQNIIFQEKTANGKRVISSISQITYKNGEITLKAIYQRP